MANFPAQEGTVSETKKTDAKTDSKADAKPQLKDSDQAKTDNPGGLAPAGQSGDPAVQKLLAEREIHRMNAGDEDEDREAQRSEARKAIADIDKRLRDLGYSAS